MVEKSPERWQDQPLDQVDPQNYRSVQDTDLKNDLKSLDLKKLNSEQPLGSSRVLHNFGDSDFQKGIEKIDLRKFMGPRNKVEATADFINNIVKVHHRHLERHE